MKQLRRLALPAAACAALVPALAGCGAEDVAQVGLAEAADRTAKAQVAQLDGTIRLTGMGMPIPVTVKLSGTTALDRPELDVKLDLSSLAGLVGAPAGAAKTRIVVVGGRVYGQVPAAFRQAVSGGREWVSVKGAPLARAMGLDPVALSRLMRIDAGTQLAVLRKQGVLKKVGTTELRGAKVTRWRGRVRPSDSLAGVPAAERKRILRALERFGGKDGDAAMPYEVWVGEDGLVRRTIVDAAIPAEGGLTGGELKMTFDLSRFGKPAPVKAPPRADVADLTSKAAALLRQIQRSQPAGTTIG